MGKVDKYCRGGFTLIELLVYIAIMGFIIIVAGRAFSDSTGMRVRSQNMLGSAEEAGRISTILKEDISQMGTKSWGRSSASAGVSIMVFETETSVHINYNNGNSSASSTDFSSYVLTKTGNYDALTFFKTHYDASGICGAVLEIEWYVRADSTLMRKCSHSKPVKCTGQFNADTECPSEPVEMARNVAGFRLLPSRPGTENISGGGVSDILFPATGNSFRLLASTGGFRDGPTAVLNGFTQNSSSSTVHINFYLAEAGATSCKELTFLDGEEYAISFELRCDNPACRSVATNEKFNPMVMFQPGNDHLSVGLRNSDMNGTAISGVPDFLFYPPLDATANKIRNFQFSVPEETKACIGMTTAFYSPAATGRLEVENFKISRKSDKVYHFDKGDLNYNPQAATTPNKASVKAFELTLRINKKGEINNTITVIPVPNNGVLAGGI